MKNQPDKRLWIVLTIFCMAASLINLITSISHQANVPISLISYDTPYI